MSADATETDAKVLFLELADLDPSEQSRLIEMKTADRPALRSRVLALLAADDSTKDQGENDPLLFSPGAALKSGMRLGPYEITGELGEGGFARVYRATQYEPVRREVAIKVLKPGLHGPTVLERFNRERQALAAMSHPSVARVHDAGTTANGVPYFVMELFDGIPITDFCDESALSIEDRVKLAIEVCEGVHHAHVKGLIHRDIKPANVLVRPGEGQSRPNVRVIDFGIAKAVSADLRSGIPDQTAIGVPLGTPAYMSPEQAGVGAIDVDIRTDVYSLGVLLYELLTGSVPFPYDALQSVDLADMQRILRDKEPASPSTRSVELKVAEARGLASTTLRARLRGDLDWIVGKCLEKDRERRYPSANALADDLRRHLLHEPIVAGPPTASYRIRKFARRNQGLVAGSAVAATGLIVAIIAGLVLGVRTHHAGVAAIAAESLAAERAAALAIENERLRAVNGLVTRLFSASNPWLAPRMDRPPSEITLADALRDASELFANAYDESPEVETELRLLLGNTYVNLDMLEEADRELVAARTNLLALDDKKLGVGAQCLEGLILLHREEFPAAAVAFQRARIDARSYGLHELEVIGGNGLVTALYAQEQIPESVETAEETLTVALSMLGADHLESAIAGNNLGTLLKHTDRYTEALPMFERSLSGFIQSGNSIHPAALTLRANLGLLLRDLGRQREGRAMTSEAVALMQQVHGDGVPAAIHTLQHAGFVDARSDQPEHGVHQLETAFELVLRHHAEDESWLNDCRGQLAHAAGFAGQASRSDELFAEAIEIAHDLNKPTAILLNNHAFVLYETGRVDEAVSRALEALDQGIADYGEQSAVVAATRTTLGKVFADRGQIQDARAQFEIVRSIRVLQKGQEHATVKAVDVLIESLERE